MKNILDSALGVFRRKVPEWSDMSTRGLLFQWASTNKIWKFTKKLIIIKKKIDVFSRYAWVEPLKNKTAKEGERGLMIILNQVKSSKIRTDEGSEFNHKWVKTLLENKHIYHHVTMNEVKANYVERFFTGTFQSALLFTSTISDPMTVTWQEEPVSERQKT